MSNADMWALVVGFLSATFVLPVLQQPHWSDRARATLTFVYSIIVGIGTVYFTGGLPPLDKPAAVVTAILLVLVSAVGSYHGFAKPVGIAPGIERATSPSSPANPPPSNLRPRY